MTTKKLLSGAAASSLLAAACFVAGAAQAAPKTTHAIQLSLAKKGNYIAGNALGGEYSIQGTGQLTAAVPTLDAVGVFSQPNTAHFTTANNTTFSYTATGRTADTVNTAVAGTAIGAGTFADQEGKFSDVIGTVGAISISAAGAAVANPGAGAGSTATAIYSINTGTSSAATETRRVATSGNDQELFTADSQATSYTLSGANVLAFTAGGLGTSNVTVATSNALTAVVKTGATCVTNSACLDNNATWSTTHKIRAGQAGSAISFGAAHKPAYGSMTVTDSGSDAAALALTNVNVITAAGGGAGTSASLSLIQEMTTFGGEI